MPHTDFTSWRGATPWGRPRLDDILAGTAALSTQQLHNIIGEWRIYPILLSAERLNPGSTYLRSELGVRATMDRLERVIAREMEARGLDSGPFAASSRYCQRLFDQLPELLGDEDERPDEWPGRVLQNETLPPRYREVIEAAEDGLARLGARLDGQPNEPLTYRGDGLFVRGAEPLRLEGQECMVMEALVELRAATKDDLVTKSGVSDAVDVLKRVKRKYPMLAAAILLPGGPRKGGYRLILAGP